MSAIPLRRLEGKYEILAKLREGGMGAIYKVRHRLLDEVRVIKAMRPQLGEDDELKARFLREARLAIKLRHPNIAQLFDFTIDEEDGTAFIAMEFISGMTLEEVLIRGGPPPLGLALEIAQQALRALGYLHGKGLIHRDISPDNLMLTEDAEGQPLVKLIDLGIAKALGGRGEGLTQAGTFLGKIRYASPEQFSGPGTAAIDARSDLYSFGIVLYELLTGRYPIAGQDPSSLIAGHLFRPPLGFAESDPDGRVPDSLREAVLRTLAKRSADRTASARDLSRELAELHAPGGVTAEDVQWLSRRAQAGRKIPLEIEKTQPTPRREDSERRVRAELAAARQLQAQGDLDAALEAAQRALELAPAHREARHLRVRLESARLERQLDSRIQAMVGEAQRLEAGGKLQAAAKKLREAAALDAGSSAVHSRLAAVEAELARQEEARRRAGELAVAEAAIAALLQRGELDDAQRLLDQSLAELGETDSLLTLRTRLDELWQRRESAPAEAPSGEGLAEIWEAAETIAQLIARRDTDAALKELHNAELRCGHRAELDGLRRRLAELVLADDSPSD